MVSNKFLPVFLILGILFLNACKQDNKQASFTPVDLEPDQGTGLTYAVTINGKRLYEIPEPDSILKKNKEDLDNARMHYLGNLAQVKPYLQYGAQCLKSGMIENALLILGKAAENFPNTADVYLYRGIASVQGRQFGAAINDFWKAGKAVEGQKNMKGMLDRTEEEKKIDASIHYDIYTWMGLAFQCQGDFSNADKMFEICGDFSTNPDLYCMSYYWQYQAYKRSGRGTDADRILKNVDEKMNISPAIKPYMDALLYYKGIRKDNELVDLNKKPTSSAEAKDWTIKAYAIAVKSFLDKDEQRYLETLEKIIEIPYWNQMAYIAAEADHHKLKGFDYKQMETTELSNSNKK
jgi:tetratricopeptide (TPR) repeat protein